MAWGWVEIKGKGTGSAHRQDHGARVALVVPHRKAANLSVTPPTFPTKLRTQGAALAEAVDLLLLEEWLLPLLRRALGPLVRTRPWGSSRGCAATASPSMRSLTATSRRRLPDTSGYAAPERHTFCTPCPCSGNLSPYPRKALTTPVRVPRPITA